MQAFALKENQVDKFAGGTVAKTAGGELNVRELLAAKDQTVQVDGESLDVKQGYIVVVDAADVEVLSSYEPLKQVSIKEATRVAKKSPAAGDKENS